MVYARNYGRNDCFPNTGWNGVSVADMDRFLPTLAQQITQAVETTFGRISLLNQNQESLTIRAAYPIRELAWEPHIGRQFSLAALPKHRMAVQTRQPILIRNNGSDSATSSMEWESTLSPEAQSGALIPVANGKGAWALISLGEMRSWDRSPLTSRKVELCQVLADLTTTSLENARRYEESSRQARELATLFQKTASLCEQARRLATTDHLTGLRNRRYLDEALARETALVARYGSSLSLIMLDVDDFKRCNDLYGHQAGDGVLHELARVLESHVRQVDVVVRYGGEEFIILLPHTDRRWALEMGERTRRAVRAHSFAGGKEGRDIRITISLGVAAYPQDASGASELIACADEALHAAKRAGKNRACAYVKSPGRRGATVCESERTRILIADHDPRVREALYMLLEQEPEWVVVESSDVESMVEQIREFKPDLLLLDWEMPGRPAAVLVLTIKGLEVTPEVIALSRRPESEAAALNAGADAFIPKTDPPEIVLEALRTLAQGRRAKVFA